MNLEAMMMMMMLMMMMRIGGKREDFVDRLHYKTTRADSYSIHTQITTNGKALNSVELRDNLGPSNDDLDDTLAVLALALAGDVEGRLGIIECVTETALVCVGS